MRREERVTVQGPVKEQQPDEMSHMGVLLKGLGWMYSLSSPQARPDGFVRRRDGGGHRDRIIARGHGSSSSNTCL